MFIQERPNQLKDVEDIRNIFATKHYVAMDTSQTGRGKTYIACMLAKSLRLSLFVMSPKSSRPKWHEVADAYRVPLIKCMTLKGLSGERGNYMKHKYLHRRDWDEEHKGRITKRYEFTYTKEFRKLVDEGILLVIDEVQYCKNASTYNCAAAELIRGLYPGDTSKGLLMSGTPFDKKTCYSNICKMFGLIGNEKHWSVFNYSTLIQKRGIITFTKKMRSLDNTCPLFRKSPGIKNINGYVKKCWPIIQANLCTECKLDEDALPHIIMNGFYRIHDEDKELYEQGLFKLKTIMAGLEQKAGVLRDSFTNINIALMMIANAKKNIFVRVAKQILVEEPNCKVVIFGQFLKMLQTICDELSDYESLYIDGSYSMIDRENVRNEFNNNPYARVLCMSQGIVTGIDLDDKVGDKPRRFLLFPGYNFTDLMQCVGKGDRVGTASITKSIFIYGKDDEEMTKEKRLLSALLAKKGVLEDSSGRKIDGIAIDKIRDYIEP